MIELLFAGLIIGAGATILALHFSRRLKPIPAAAEAAPRFSAVGVDLTGNNPSPIDPRYARMVELVLTDPASKSGWRTLLP